jgi:transposase
MTKPVRADPKLAAHKESGTANPHARDLSDPAFVGSDFFDPRDLVQVRYEMLRRVRIEGQPIAEAAARFGISRPTFYKAQSDFEGAGLVGLLPEKRGPRGPHKVTAEVLRFIEQLRGKNEVMDIRALTEAINRRFGLSVHRRTVERALARSKKNFHERLRCYPRRVCAGRTLRSFPQRRRRSRQSTHLHPGSCLVHASGHGGVDEERRRTADARPTLRGT